MTFFGYLAESSSNDLTDSEIDDLIRIGIIEPFEIRKSQIESKLGIKLSELRISDVEHLRLKIIAYSIVDKETGGSNTITLHLCYTVDETGISKLSGFCFRNLNMLNIPLNVHSVSELAELKRANKSYRQYYTSIDNLTRKAYLSAIDNSDFDIEDNASLEPESFLRSKAGT